MRIVIAFFLSAFSLAACDEAVSPAPSSVTPEQANTAAMKSAAEEECAAMTNHTPDKLKTMTTEMQALVTREYKSCVEAVTRGSAPARPVN